jgi:hypothetical protein
MLMCPGCSRFIIGADGNGQYHGKWNRTAGPGTFDLLRWAAMRSIPEIANCGHAEAVIRAVLRNVLKNPHVLFVVAASWEREDGFVMQASPRNLHNFGLYHAQ